MLASTSTTLDPTKVSPGVTGFLVVFFLALATWLLIRSMVGHLRKVRYQAERDAEARAEAQAEGEERSADDAEAQPNGATS